MRPGSKARFKSIYFTSSTTLTAAQVKTYGCFVAQTAGIILTIPTPAGTFWGHEIMFVNQSSGFVSLDCTAGFVDGSGGKILAPGETVYMECNKITTSSYAWLIDGKDDLPKWKTWTPTVTYTTANPADYDTNVIARYYVENGICFFDFSTWSDDGNAASAVTITPPIWPNDLDAHLPVSFQELVDTTWANKQGYIECANNTVESRLISCRNFAEATNGKAFALRVTGAYPVALADAWSPTLTYATGTPANAATVAQEIRTPAAAHLWLYDSSADGNGVTAVTLPPPSIPHDSNQYIVGAAYQLSTTTYSNPCPMLDQLNNTGASRIISFDNLTTTAIGKAWALSLYLMYEYGRDWYSYTPTETFTTGTPATWTSVFRYTVKGRLCYFTYSGTSADGNGATALTVTLPVLPKYEADRECALMGYQLVNTTDSDPCAYIDMGQATATDRAKIRFSLFSACTDAQACRIYVAGCFEIDG